MNFKIYNNIFNDDNINYILKSINEKNFVNGKVGNRINLDQKRRRDLYITNSDLLSKIDDIFYENLYDDIKINFSDIKYREKWKIGHYNSDNKGFYNLHTDSAGDTNYRITSSVSMLSEENDYEGGELHFPDLNKKIKLKKGQVIVFKSNLLHGVYPVTSGDRKVLISFYFDDEGMKKKLSRNNNVNYLNYKPILTNSYVKINYTSLGDIDYSDLHNNHKWSQKDDYIFEDNNSDMLLVSFAGMGWKKSPPTFIFYNFLKSYNNLDKLFLRDLKMRYYITGLLNSSKNYDETLKLIRNLVNVKKYKKIIALGCSAGGFAAILYGSQLNFDKIIAFSPQTVINKKKETLIHDIYNAPNTCKWLTSLNKDNEIYQKSLDLKNFQPFKSKIDIHYSINGNKGIDKKHAEYLLSENCQIIEHPGNDHMIAISLRNNGKLKKIIDNELI